MEKIQIDSDEYILYSPDSLTYITDNMKSILDKSLSFYKKLFGIEKFRKFQINYFDNIEDFREFIYSIRGEKESLPKYAKGTFDRGMINAFIEPNILINSPLYNKKIYVASHELFHIMYKELILKYENKKRVVWFDEGMAQLFSGEYSDLINDENFKNWLNNLIKSTYEIPNLNEINHGNSFENDKYNGYKLSLLAVKYLFDVLGIEQFKELMHDIDRIEKYGSSVVEEAFNLYINKFNNIK